MARTFTRSKGIFVLFGLGLALMTLLACTSRVATPQGTVPSPDTESGRQAETGGSTSAERAMLELAEQRRSAAGAAAGLQVPVAMRSGILVSGRGEASATPDLAILNLGVEAFAGTVAGARDDAADAMGRVMEVLKGMDLPERDMQTRFFNISPRYTSREVTRCPNDDGPAPRSQESALPTEPAVAPLQPSLGIPEGPAVEISRSATKDECFQERERVIVGYEVSNQLTVKVRDLDSIGGVIDEVTKAGGDLIRFQGIDFTIEEADALQDQARAAAIEDVMAKANQVATLTGVQLGKLIHVSETGGPPRNPGLQLERAAFAAAAPKASTSIMAGELEVVITVQALYGIE